MTARGLKRGGGGESSLALTLAGSDVSMAELASMSADSAWPNSEEKRSVCLAPLPYPTSAWAPLPRPWLTCTLQGHLHGVGDLLLLGHTA